MAKGPTPARMLPQFGVTSTFGLSIADLAEQKIDVAIGPLRPRHDGDLARQRMGAADAVDLARIRRAHDRQEQRVARGRIGGKVVGQEIGALGGAAPKDHARNARLNGPSPLMR